LLERGGKILPLRILQLGSPTGLYGAERWILALIKHLNQRKIYTIVGVIKDDPSLEAPIIQKAKELGFETAIIEAYGRFNLSAVTKLRDLIKAKNIHILHTHGYKQDLIGFLATKGTNCKIIATPHGWSKEPDLKLKLYEILNRLCFLCLDKVVPLSQEIYNGLAKIPGLRRKLFLIQNAVDLSEIEEVKDIPQELRRAREEGYFILGYIGQLIHRKGVDVFLRALARLDKEKIKAFIIGEGPLKASLQRLALNLGLQETVIFTGYREDRLNFLRGFDLFVLPSRLEGVPRCLMEAMGMGKPVIASDIKGCRSLIPEPGVQGYLFPIEDYQTLAKHIQYLKAHPEIRQSLGLRAQEFIKKNYSAERMAKEYEALYAMLI